MLEEMLTELRYKGYNVTIRQDDFSRCVNIHMKKKFKDQWHGINHLVPFCESAMIYALRLMVNEMEKEMEEEINAK